VRIDFGSGRRDKVKSNITALSFGFSSIRDVICVVVSSRNDPIVLWRLSIFKPAFYRELDAQNAELAIGHDKLLKLVGHYAYLSLFGGALLQHSIALLIVVRIHNS
jgi:hypothetical protein